MIGTKRKAGRDTAGQAFAAEGNGHFTESRRLRQLPPAAPALALRAGLDGTLEHADPDSLP